MSYDPLEMKSFLAIEDSDDNDSKFIPHDPSQEPIFPPELTVKSDEYARQPLAFQGDKMTWFKPTTLDELLTLKESYPDAKLVVGNTELGIEMKFKKQ